MASCFNFRGIGVVRLKGWPCNYSATHILIRAVLQAVAFLSQRPRINKNERAECHQRADIAFLSARRQCNVQLRASS